MADVFSSRNHLQYMATYDKNNRMLCLRVREYNSHTLPAREAIINSIREISRGLHCTSDCFMYECIYSWARK